MTISEKITLLNQTTLESLNEKDNLAVIKNFTETGLKILGADFGFAWWKTGKQEVYELAYKTENTPYSPQLPREHGGNFEAQKNKTPFFVGYIKKENYEEGYDVSLYMQSYVIIPVAYNDHIYGNLVVCYNQQRNFSEEDKSLCISIGNSAAQAITIHRLVKSEQEARVQAENQEARFRALIENSYDGILLVDAQGKILDVSRSVNRMTGYSVTDLLGHNIAEYIRQENLPAIESYITKILEDSSASHTLEFRYLHQDGSSRWLESTGVNMLGSPNVGSIVVNIRDITERKLSQDTILHQALHDSLTGLPNRKEFAINFDQALEAAKHHKRMLALMFLDMDRFKSINDSLGHAVGDTLLKVAATRFVSCVRAEDTVARFGGDEFLVALNEIHSSQEACMVAEKILKAIAIPVQIGQQIFHPSVSIGIAVYPSDGQDRESLKKYADIALYRAKANGRNTYSLYNRSMDSYGAEKFALENELRAAMTSEQISLYWQPIINIKTGKVLSVEGLARWQHPTKGLLLPNEFIPLAEETGLISVFGEYILKAACKQYKAWEALNFPKFKVAVNLSAQSFGESKFISQLGDILEQYDMQPGNLEIEITESMAMANLELTSSNLKQLKKMGVRISIDDFGTGYSSLNYLKSFPLYNLKIDRSFVRHCISNDQDASIVRTIISMAHNLNLKVIAEGVEDGQQLNFLAGLGCDAAQGFYISKPLEAAQLQAWLEEKNLKKKVAAN